MEFPRLVYRSASEHLLTENDEQYAEAIADGWYGSVPEAIAKKHNETFQQSANTATTREELEAQAKELGIKFDGRNSDASLQRMIDEALDK